MDIAAGDRPDSQALVDILSNIHVNRQANVSKAFALGGNDLRSSVRNLIQGETPQQLAGGGESTFPLPQGPQEALRSLRQSELENLFDPTKATDATKLRNLILADERVQSLEGNFATGQELDETRKSALTLAYQQLATNIDQKISRLKSQDFNDDKIKGIMAGDLDRFLDSGELTSVVEAQETRITQFNVGQDEQERVEKLSTRQGKIDALKDWAFQNGVDISSNAITPGALAELQRKVPNTGIGQEFADLLESQIPVFQQQKQNIEFAKQKPEARQAKLGRALGFGVSGGPTFGTQRGGLTFGTAFDRGRQEAFQGSQADALARIDAQVKQAIIDDPNLDLPRFVEDLRRPGATFTTGFDPRDIGFLEEDVPAGVLPSLEGRPAPGFAQDIPGRIQQIREQQPTISGLLPGQVPGSLSEAQRFGFAPPTPPLAAGQPTIGGRAQGPRGGRLRPEFRFDRERINHLISDAAGGDVDLTRFLLERVGSPEFMDQFGQESRELDIQEREEDKFSVAHTFESVRDPSGELTGAPGKFITTKTRRRATPGTTEQNVFSFAGFAKPRLAGLKTEFEDDPLTIARRETSRRRGRGFGGGQARFNVFGNRRF